MAYAVLSGRLRNKLEEMERLAAVCRACSSAPMKGSTSCGRGPLLHGSLLPDIEDIHQEAPSVSVAEGLAAYLGDQVPCNSYHCRFFFDKNRARHELAHLKVIEEILEHFDDI